MIRYCDFCKQEIIHEQTVYELRIENQDKAVLEHKTACEPCLSAWPDRR